MEHSIEPSYHGTKFMNVVPIFGIPSVFVLSGLARYKKKPGRKLGLPFTLTALSSILFFLPWIFGNISFESIPKTRIDASIRCERDKIWRARINAKRAMITYQRDKPCKNRIEPRASESLKYFSHARVFLIYHFPSSLQDRDS